MAASGLKGWRRIVFEGAEPSALSRIVGFACGAAAFALPLIVGGALPARTLPPLMREPGMRMIVGLGLAIVVAMVAVRFAAAGLRRVVRERPGPLTSTLSLLGGTVLAAVGFAAALAIWDTQGGVRVFMGVPAALGVVLALTGGLGLVAEVLALRRNHDVAAEVEEGTLAEALGTSPEEADRILCSALAKREQHQRQVEARERVVCAIMTGEPEPARARPTRGGKGVVFRCPGCEHRMVVPVAWAGRKGRCPSCKAAAELPALMA